MKYVKLRWFFFLLWKGYHFEGKSKDAELMNFNIIFKKIALNSNRKWFGTLD